MTLHVTPAPQTGHPDIDGQVRTLFAIANEVLFSKELAESPDQFRHGLGFFVAYLSYHFASEEVAMAESSYPAGLVHADFHEYVLREATAIQERGMGEGSSVAARHRLLCMVEDWLYYHVKEDDWQFADFLREMPTKREIVRLPGICDLGASGLLRRDFDDQMLKRLVEMGHPERWPSGSQRNESSPRAEHGDANRA